MHSATVTIPVYIICEGTSSSLFYRQRSCTQRTGEMFSRSKSQTWMSLNWNLSFFDFTYPIMSHLFCLHQEFTFFENKNISLTKISPFFSYFVSNMSYLQMGIYSPCLWGLLWSDLPEKHSFFCTSSSIILSCKTQLKAHIFYRALLDRPMWSSTVLLSNFLGIYPILSFIVIYLCMLMPISSIWLIMSYAGDPLPSTAPGSNRYIVIW